MPNFLQSLISSLYSISVRNQKLHICGGYLNFRDMARQLKPHVTEPEIVAPMSIHPAFNKAADYFGLTVVCAELTDGYEADVDKLEKVDFTKLFCNSIYFPPLCDLCLF